MLTKYFDLFGHSFLKMEFGTYYTTEKLKATSQWNTEVGQVSSYRRAVFSAS